MRLVQRAHEWNCMREQLRQEDNILYSHSFLAFRFFFSRIFRSPFSVAVHRLFLCERQKSEKKTQMN